MTDSDERLRAAEERLDLANERIERLTETYRSRATEAQRHNVRDNAGKFRPLTDAEYLRAAVASSVIKKRHKHDHILGILHPARPPHDQI